MNIRVLPLFVLLSSLAVSGCAGLDSLPLVSELPSVPVPEALRIERVADKPGNLIERALSGCDKRTEIGEAACVKSALTGAKTSVPTLAAMLHGCRSGQICHCTYTTDDRIGLYSATASHFVVHWRVDFDFTHSPAAIDAVPITVAQV